MSESGTVGYSRTISVAAGPFAPGHLGELTQVIPFELVDAVLAETGRMQRRVRVLPARVGVYFVLALGLFEEVGARLVWSKLVAGLRGLAGLSVASPSEKALRQVRRRLGPAPFKALFEVLATPLASPRTPGVAYRHWRVVAFDGCASLRVPDSGPNRAWLGKHCARFGLAGYPALMLMTLAECGTRALLGAVFGPAAPGERSYARRLAHLLDAGMLVLLDRGFDGDGLLAELASTGAQVLARVKSSRRPPMLAPPLPDGSYLTRIGELKLRVIEATITVTTKDGDVIEGGYRLLTTLLDPRKDPAATLVGLYHERWEIESAYYALRHTLLNSGRVLRSGDPAGIEQEMWALLALYQAIRTAMVTATQTIAGTDPDRAGFTTALSATRDTLITATGITPSPHQPADLTGTIGTAVLANLLPPRRMRISARNVKSGISRYHTWNKDNRPPKPATITTITLTIHHPTTPQPPRGRWHTVHAIMTTRPNQPWHARDIAQALGLTTPNALNSLRTLMNHWAKQGLLTKTSQATYTITPPKPPQPP